MPHISVEYSKNIKGIDFHSLFADIHQILSQVTKVTSCKSRAICLQDYYVGDGDEANGIFFIRVNLMSGRTVEQKNKLAQDIKQLVNTMVVPIINQLGINCLPTLEMVELQHYTRL